jgi:kynurenine formamidase
MPELMKRIVDLSHAIGPATPVFPGDPPVDITVVESTQDPPMSERRRLNCSRIGLIVHVGTHMDAPFHFFEAGETIDRVPLDRCVGPAVLVDLRHLAAGEEIGREHLKTYAKQLTETGKAVLHTGWSKQWGKEEYFSEHPRISGEGAQFLVDCGVHLVGVDTPSVDRPPFPAHLALLGSGVLIVENLTNLDSIEDQVFQIYVLPLKIAGRDGSPVRAIATQL